MEIIQKLNIFHLSAIEVANQQSAEILRNQTATMRRLFQEYQKNKQNEIDTMYQIEEAKLRREQNRKLSEAQTEQKRQLSQHQKEKKDALFGAVLKKIQEFCQSDQYGPYLLKKILEAKQFAGESEVEIYLSRQDAGKRNLMEQKSGCLLLVSEHDFIGGIRAVIKARNVLIDESFETKLSQEINDYTF